MTDTGPIVHAIGLDLAVAMPDAAERGRVVADLARHGQALVVRDGQLLCLVLSRMRPGAGAPASPAASPR